MQRLVESQSKLIRNALLETQPVQFITEQRRDMIAASAAVDESSRSIADILQSVDLL